MFLKYLCPLFGVQIIVEMAGIEPACKREVFTYLRGVVIL